MTEIFIAIRYFKAKHKLNFISIITLLSTIGVTIGVAALIVVLSVFNGFSSIVKNNLISYDPHIRVTFPASADIPTDSIFSRIQNLEEIKSVSAYSSGKGIIKGTSNFEIIEIKGIDSAAAQFGVSQKIIAGNYDLKNDSNGKIVISFPLALRLSVRVGDTLSVTSFNNLGKSLRSFAMPKVSKLKVSGIYETNNKEIDDKFAYVSLSTAQMLHNSKNRVTGLELRLREIENAADVKEQLEAEISVPEVKISTWYDLHKDLYDVMLIERWSAYILLSLIIAVAVFNILGSLTMTVIEKSKDIGVLRTMGMNGNSIQKLFMFEGMLIGTIGTIVGLAIGLSVCYAQINFNFYSLDAAKYVIDALPVVVNFSDVLVVGAGSMLLTYFAALYPARKSLKTNIIEAVKWE